MSKKVANTSTKAKPSAKQLGKTSPTEAAEQPQAAKQPERVDAAKPEKKGPKPARQGGGLVAAHQVLAAAKQPMNVRDITKAAMDKGLWAPGGKTPWATLAAAMGREIKDKGKQSRFKKTDRGLFTASGVKA